MRSATARGPPSTPRLAVALLVMLVLGATIGGPMAGVARAQASGAEDEEMILRVAVRTDGDARWTVTMAFTLETPNETQAFDRLSTEFEEGDAEALSVAPFRRAADDAESTTGRSMSIDNVSREASRGNRTGRLVLSFTWTNFARSSGNRLALGDVFRTDRGTWLPGLAEGQSLHIEFPPGYAPRDLSHPLVNGSLQFQGPIEFQPGEPSAVLERTGPGETTTTSQTSPGTLSDTPSRGLGLPMTLGLGVVVVLAGVIVYLFTRSNDKAADTEDESPGEPASPAVSAGAGTDEIPPSAADSDEEAPLLSDEERILRLLESHGGRMKQVAIVDETDWSNAKVSQLLSEMDEQGLIDKLRIGRENLISLPDESPRGEE